MNSLNVHQQGICLYIPSALCLDSSGWGFSEQVRVKENIQASAYTLQILTLTREPKRL